MAIILRYQTWLELFCILKTIKDALKIPTMTEKKNRKDMKPNFSERK